MTHDGEGSDRGAGARLRVDTEPEVAALEPETEPETASAPEAASPPAPAPAGTSVEPVAHPRRRRLLRVVLRLLLLALVLALAVGAAVLVRHLWLTAEAWESRSAQYLDEARTLGSELASTRGELEGARAEIEAVGAQLATAQARIVELADEKARLGDDRETQRQLVDYQARVSEAGGRVALALDQCVQGQQQLIGYLEAQVSGAIPADPAELTAFRQDVEALCQAATEANISLQRELAR